MVSNVCLYKKCALCKGLHLGLTMAWRVGMVEHIGHVCYGCEDRVCNEIAAGRSEIKWLNSLSGCADGR